MALGLETGTVNLQDFDGYVETMEAASRVYDKFRERYGTARCHMIQERLFGRKIDFFNDEDAAWWYENNGLDKCPGVCAVAARLAAQEIFGIRDEG
jgi:hypothetical protein